MNCEVLNIVVPMAGRGSRFAKAGYDLPKPLLSVRGRPMIEVVIENLRPSCSHRFIFICQREHILSHDLDRALLHMAPTAEIIPIDGVTEGAACTVLLAEQFINTDTSLMIANCDQYVAVGIDDYLWAMEEGNYDGFIMTMMADDPKWSFVRLDDAGRVTEVVEKQVVSSEATVGIYNYRRGCDFISAAKAMIAVDDRVSGEFYVAPVYNYMIRKAQRIGFMNIGSDRAGMYGLGVPEDLEFFNALSEMPRACR